MVFSGGMDSGLIAALAKNCARSVICYTLRRFYCTNLAELFGVSRNTIGNWVNDSKPKPDGT